ncbi:ImmA/IrrE family metallo-endopeptidase [Terribacillus saccharophilus]|uniref:ImmA/IrrE family metallo-endopeptidase n=1 Tax=Terribacillus saccharophilus TaxID=361277 RepID=UPI000C9B9731|nr:ImmA/IrrE family metallo-endopeptidase [Terribacillus goriensis]
METVDLANKLIKKYGTSCPFKIAEQLGIIVLYENLGGSLGYFSKQFRIKIIHINESANEKMQRFICAHELGHAVLHPEVNTPFMKKQTLFSTASIEIEANLFAIHLITAGSNTPITMKEAFSEYGFPVELINERLNFFAQYKNIHSH